ncbi:hypothetical protein SAZ10_00480 [Mesorhizobium sp. BAC0120]|uniref:hypothetical protein n=1 Tax=Mesorhizobium sp. BAC0120 TaxID=3090670 RepID=UPI00298D47FB|nr:hypothetical protein [Mesorhizobium sp. BAC0120]MDW6020231.1 hypothetical protein [Mesorhizobium sp. BAC0120]
MTGSIWYWDLTASSNDTADPDIDWREGMFPDVVNDSARMMMQRVAALLKDLGGSLITGGTAAALTLTANSQFSALQTGLRVSFTANVSNTGATTINVNSMGAKAIRKAGAVADVAIAAGDIIAGQVYHLVYSAAANATAGAWILQNPTASSAGFAAGTRWAFHQAAAPLGWTKLTDTAYNDAALRVVTGTGGGTAGSVAFATAFQSATPTSSTAVTVSVAGTALTVAQLPAHTHASGTLAGSAASAGAHIHGPGTLTGATGAAGSHSHSFPTRVTGGGGGPAAAGQGDGGGLGPTISVSTDGNHSHSVSVTAGATASAGAHTHTVDVNSGATTSVGSGDTHAHTASSPAHSHTVNLAVKYVDVIVCEKA